MKKAELREFDVARYLKTESAMAEYLNAELAEGDPHYIKIALNNIARARSMTQIAQKAGISRVGLYRALSVDGNPEYGTIQKIVDDLDMSLVVVPKNNTAGRHRLAA
jgi:probable addiction module antidote protein